MATVWTNIETGSQQPVARSRVKLLKSAVQSIPNIVETAVTWDVEDKDDEDLHSLTTNTSRITVKTPGDYLVGGTLRLVNNISGRRDVRLYKNGVGVPSNVQTLTASRSDSVEGIWAGVVVIFLANLIAGDYLELAVFQNSGVALDVLLEPGGGSPNFWSVRIA